MRMTIKRAAAGMKGKTVGRSILVVAVLGLALGLASETGAVPQTINYQGLLVQDGVPVDGAKGVRFRIYENAEGGTQLWQEVQTVTFSEGLFSVLLGTVEPIPISVFSGARRWLSVSIEGGPEILPRGEIASVGYAFNSATSQQADTSRAAGTASTAAQAGNADLLDGYDSSQFSGATHTHDSRYYTQTQLKTSDGTPPNQGSNYVHWNTLTGVPEGFADGTDDSGTGGTTDHGELSGLLDNDHPQYALKDSLKTSDGTPPNQGSNAVHWNVLAGMPEGFADGVDDAGSGGVTDHGELSGLLDDDHPQYALEDSLATSDGTPPNQGSNTVNWNNLTGVPGDFADGADNITTNASLITTGTMSPSRVAGTAVIDSDARLLTVGERSELTEGGQTSLHYHVEPFVAHAEADTFKTSSTNLVAVDSVVVDAPRDGFVSVTFSGSQLLDVAEICCPQRLAAKRYIAIYGVGIDTTDAVTYSLTSSMQDTVYYSLGRIHVPAKAVMGNTVRPVSAGQHTVYFLTRITVVIDANVTSKLESPSLTVVYFPFEPETSPATRLGGGASQGGNSAVGGLVGEGR